MVARPGCAPGLGRNSGPGPLVGDRGRGNLSPLARILEGMKKLLLAGLLTLAPALAGGAGAPPPAQATLRMTAPDGTVFTMRERTAVTMRLLGDAGNPLAQAFAGVPPFVSETVTRHAVRRTAAGAEIVARTALPLPQGGEAEIRQVQVFGPAGELRGVRIESDAPELAPFVAAVAEAGDQNPTLMYGMPLRAGAARTVTGELDLSDLMNSLMGGLLPPGADREFGPGGVVRAETTVTALGPQAGGFGFRMVARTAAFAVDVALPGGGEMSMRGEPSEMVGTVVYDAQGLPLRGEVRGRQQLTMTVRMPGEAPVTVRLEQETVNTSARE